MIGVTSGTVFDGFDVSNIYFDDLYADRCFDVLAAANDYIAHLDDEGGVYDALRDKYLSLIQEKFGHDSTMDFYIYEE